MYDEETGTEITFEKIDGKDYTVITITGVLDLESADKIGHLVNDSIPIEYDGNVIFDIRKADDRLRNEDADEAAELVFRSRYFLRKPVAVLAPAESPGRSRRQFQNTAERGGILIRDFTTMEAAIAWLDNPDG